MNHFKENASQGDMSGVMPQAVQQQIHRSAMAIAGLVLGIIAMVTSLLPIINNLSFVLALLGAIFSIVGIVACVRGSRHGKGVAIVSLVINIVAIALVLGSQSMYSAALDDAVNGPDVSNVQDANGKGNDTASQGGMAPQGDTATQEPNGQTDTDTAQPSTDLAVGTRVTLENGVDVTVDSVQTGLQNYDGSTVTGVHVTYANNGSEPVNFATGDWKGEDAQGTQAYTTFYSDASDDLETMGTIAAGGTASGNIYFEGDISKVLYYASILTKNASASWTLQ